MTSSTPGADPWPQLTWEQRFYPIAFVLPYPLLAALVALTVAQNRSSGGALLIDLGLCAAAAVWMLWMFTLHPAWHDRPVVMGVFVVGLIVITGVLVVRDPWFGCFTPAGYIFSFNVLRKPWDLPAVAAVAVVAAMAQASDIHSGTALHVAEFAAVVALNVVPMSALAWFGWKHETHHSERELALYEVSEANRRLETTLAENAGLHEQLVIQAREAGVLDERARMAREIHDTLAQGLAGIVTQLQAAEHAADDPATWRRHFEAATRLARESLSEARRSVDALRPESLQTARLSDALAVVAERWSGLSGVTTELTTTGTARSLPPDAELALLRTLQEALANVAKHARAENVWVTLSYLDSEVALDVSDDGRGFDPTQLDAHAPTNTTTTNAPTSADTAQTTPTPDTPETSGGFGLVAMRQRIEGISGTLQVESEPGAGTTISACVPQQFAGFHA